MFGIHWIPTHCGDPGSMPDREIIARWNPAFVKIITVDNQVPCLESVPAAALIVVRNHPMSEDGNRGAVTHDEAPHRPGTGLHPAAISEYAYHEQRPPLYDPQETWQQQQAYESEAPQAEPGETPYQRGLRHATICDEMARYCEGKGVSRERLRFEGLNELQLWAGEPPWWSAEYYRGFLVGLHGYGLRGVVGNLGVGWPGNGGAADAPPEWEWFRPVINEFQVGDHLGLHEYWALNGPQQNWLWWAGRFLQCPYQVPILITETGIDTGVTGQWYGGWRDLPGNSEEEKAVRYSNELVWYAQQCYNDGRIKQVFTFTYDIGSSHWEKFDIRSWAFLDEFFKVKDQVPTRS